MVKNYCISLHSFKGNFDHFSRKNVKITGNEECPQKSASIYRIVSVVLLTYWIVFHLESTKIFTRIRLKMNQDLIAWRDMAGRNWITTILSNHGWCTWTTIINGQRIPAEKNGYLFFLFDNYKTIPTYPQLECASKSKDRKLISIVCPICTWISQVKSSFLS